jgi:serine/threonine protein kinase
MNTHDSIIGRIIEGKYEILDKIGEGGMAIVYKAYQKNLERIVALKVIKESFASNEDFLKKFIREAKAMAGISHPNVIRVYDYGQDGDLYFIVMEYLDGDTLDKIIKSDNRLSVDQILEYLSPIAEALHAIHKKGLVHRDIKSSNIFITHDGHSILMDFGIAYYTDRTIDLNNILGTPEYMSPEQTQGSKLDGRSDLYSLGIVMYESLTGQVPFSGDSITAVITKVLNEKPSIPRPDESQIPRWLLNLVNKLLEKKAENRIESAEALIKMLQSRKSTIQLDAISKIRGIAQIKNYRKVLGISSGLLILILFVIAINFFIGQSQRISTLSTSEPVNNNQENELLTHAEQFMQLNNFSMAFRMYNQIPSTSSHFNEAEIQKEICLTEMKTALFMDELQLIPGGSFYMGSEKGRDDEKPLHKVNINPFRITKYEITNKQFCEFLNASGCAMNGKVNGVYIFDKHSNPRIIFNHGEYTCQNDASSLPAYGVTWDGANLFCHFFNGRLPTEAEWEYVASECGVNKTNLTIPQNDQIAWYSNNSGGIVHEVGMKNPNSLGVFDLSGNVWEWCQDFYRASYYSTSLVNNPMGPSNGTSHVIRGGDCQTPGICIQSTYRSNANSEGNTGDFIGFRMVTQ